MTQLLASRTHVDALFGGGKTYVTRAGDAVVALFVEGAFAAGAVVDTAPRLAARHDAISQLRAPAVSALGAFAAPCLFGWLRAWRLG